MVKDYIRRCERRGHEMFVSLAHSSGYDHAEFGEAVVIIGAIEQKTHFFVMDLRHSDACSMRAYPATAEVGVDGQVHGFAFFEHQRHHVQRALRTKIFDREQRLLLQELPPNEPTAARGNDGPRTHSRGGFSVGSTNGYRRDIRQGNWRASVLRQPNYTFE